MADRPALSAAARDSVLDALLRQRPEAWVVAIAPTGLFTTMPAAVPVDGHPVVSGYASALEMVVASDQQVVIDAWRRALDEGAANTAVHPVNTVDRLVGLHFIDFTERFGVLLGLFVGFDEDDAHGSGEHSPLVPRSSVLRKDQLSVVTGVDDAISAILGWTADDLVGRRTLELVHPDDQERAIANWMDMLSRPGSSRRVRLRHQHRDGSWRWLEVTNHNHLDDPDHPYVLAEMLDVNDEVTALEALRANEQLLRRLTEALPVGVLHIDVDRTVTYCNERLTSIVGVTGAKTVSEQLAFAVPADQAAVVGAIDAALERGRDVDVEVSFQPPAEKVRRCVLSLRALTSHAGRIAGAIACLVDITEDVNLREELEQRVRYDPLTGCLNHASVLAELEHRLAQPHDRTWIVVLFIDLDDFKDINDRYGHVAGDRVLKHVATRLRQVAGDDGLVGRLGGDEFLVVLRTAAEPSVLAPTSKRVAAALESSIMLGPTCTKPKASLGLAWASDERPSDADGLVAAADAAMYESKRLGAGAPVIAPSS